MRRFPVGRLLRPAPIRCLQTGAQDTVDQPRQGQPLAPGTGLELC